MQYFTQTEHISGVPNLFLVKDYFDNSCKLVTTILLLLFSCGLIYTYWFSHSLVKRWKWNKLLFSVNRGINSTEVDYTSVYFIFLIANHFLSSTDYRLGTTDMLT